MQPPRLIHETTRVQRKPVWGTCAGMILLAEAANRTKQGGQDLIGGLDVRVNRNYFGRQVESFETTLDLPFLAEEGGEASAAPFRAMFIRAPVVERILPSQEGIQSGEEAKSETVIAPSRKALASAAPGTTSAPVEILGVLPNGSNRNRRARLGIDESVAPEDDIVAVRQGNVLATSFHPELTEDARLHIWWLRQVLAACKA